MQQAFGCANATRGDQPAPLANPLHTEHETSAYFAQYMIFWYAHIIEEEFRGRPATHGGYRARCPAHGPVNEEAGDAAVLGWLVAIGDGEDHGEVGFITAGNKYFLPINHPVAAIFHRGGADARGIRTGSRLGEGKARPAFAFNGGNEIFGFLLLVAMVEDIISIATKGKRHKCAPHLNGDQGRHYCSQVGSSIFLWCIDTPEAQILCFHLEIMIEAGLDTRWIFAFSLHDLIFERHKFAVHETPYGLLDHFLFVCQGEIHGGPFRLWLVALYAGVGQSIQLF